MKLFILTLVALAILAILAVFAFRRVSIPPLAHGALAFAVLALALALIAAMGIQIELPKLR